MLNKIIIITIQKKIKVVGIHKPTSVLNDNLISEYNHYLKSLEI